MRSEDLPDPDGPIRPTLCDFSTSREMFFKIVICPALLLSDKDTSLRERIGSDMSINRLLGHFFRTYGVLKQSSKVACLVFLASTFAAHAQTKSVLMLGDSLTQGYGLLEQDGLVPQMRDWLKEQGLTVRVINGGVSGDTTAGGLERFEWSLTPDVGAVVIALGSNDMLRGIAPEVTRQNLKNLLDIARAKDLKVLLIGVLAPLNYGPAYKEDFDRIFPDLARDYGTLYVDTFFTPLLEQSDDISQMKAFMQSDGLHPNAAGVANIVEYIGPKVAQLVTEMGINQN